MQTKIMPSKLELKNLSRYLLISDLATTYNVSPPTIKKWLKIYNLVAIKKHTYTTYCYKIDNNLMSSDYLLGLINKEKSFTKIGKILKIAHNDVKKLCIKYNIDTNNVYHKYDEYINNKCNMLLVQEVKYIKKNDKHGSVRTLAKCLCDCGNIYEIRINRIQNGTAFSCGCVRRNRISITGSQNPAFNGFGEIRSVHIHGWKNTARRRGYTWSLSKEFLWNLYLKQNKKCALSGIDIYFGRVHYRHETNASLDRIDSDKGYTEDNVQWVCKVINIMKKNYIEEDFIKLCNHVAKTHPRD